MSESRTKNTARNLTFGLVNQLVTLMLNFINRTVFIQILGAAYLGINGLFTDVLLMLSMADLGLATAMVYSYYRPLAERDHDKISALIKFYKKVYYVIAITVAIIGLSLVPFLGYIVNLENDIPFMELYYLFFLANTVISYLFVYKTSIIVADQKNYLISKYQLWVNSSRIIFQILFLLITKNYFIYLLIQLLSTLVNNIIASRKADELYPYIKTSRFELDKSEKKNIFENMKSMFIYKISSVLLNGTSNTVISVMFGTIWVGIYSNYYLVITSLNNLINLLYSSVTASIGNAIITEQSKKRFEIFQSVQTVSLITTTFTTVCLYVLFNDLITVWIGTDYVLNNFILSSIIFNFYLVGVLHPIWSYREATGLYMQTKYIMVIAGIVNLFLSIILGKLIGMGGVLFALAIARLTTYFWFEPRLLFKQYLHEKVRNYFVPLVKNFIFTIVIIVIIMMVSNNFVIDSWYKLIVKTVIVSGVTILTVIVAYHKTPGYKLIVSRIRKLIGR